MQNVACKMCHYCLIHIAPLSNINYLTSLLLSHAFRSCKHCYSTHYHQCHLRLSPQWTLIWLCCSLLSIHWLLFYLCFFSGSCQASYWRYCLSPLLFKYNCLKQLPKWHQLAADYIPQLLITSPDGLLSVFMWFFCELKCFSLQRKPLEVKHGSSRCIWHPLFPWA